MGSNLISEKYSALFVPRLPFIAITPKSCPKMTLHTFFLKPNGKKSSRRDAEAQRKK
jgi:hypothetical protein